jgi:threonine dehydrogenase-like Zn-dependent dehydrogenase
MAVEPETMRAAFFTKRGFDVRTLPIPHPGPDQVAIAVDACGICGSDLHFFSGDAPVPRVCPGHEISGRVLSSAAGLVPGLGVVVEPLLGCGTCRSCTGGEPNLCPSLQLIGRECPGGFADVLVVPTGVVHPVPDGLCLEVAMLAEPLAVALHALRKVTIGNGTEVLVLGGGTIGLLLTFLAARGGAHVTMSVRHPQQRDAALLLGAALVAMADVELPRVPDHQPDVVFETVGGHARTLELAIDCVRPGGAIVALGVFSRSPTIDPIVCLAKEVRMVWSTMYSRSDQSDFAGALGILRDEQVRLSRLVTHSVPLEEIQRGFSLASDKRSGAIKVAVRPGQKL